MAHDDHKEPGQLPDIEDEAGNTPLWVPAVGVALLAAIAVFFALGASDPELSVDFVVDPTEEPAALDEGSADEAAEVQAPAAPAAPAAAAAPPAPPPGSTPTAAVEGDTDSFGRGPGDEHFGHNHP